MYGFYHDDDHTELATPTEACREYARNVGAERPEDAWILTDWDTWEPNPYYHGPAVPHPEDAVYMDADDPAFDGE